MFLQLRYADTERGERKFLSAGSENLIRDSLRLFFRGLDQDDCELIAAVPKYQVDIAAD